MKTDYEIIGRIDQPHEPTLKDLIAIAVANRRDRLCLVKEPREDKSPGLVILLIGDKAISQVGPFLLKLARTLNEPGEGDQLLYIKFNQSCRHIIDWMHENGLRHCTQDMRIGEQRALHFCLYGPFVNDQLCADFTRLGVPCKLK